ncbi:MAG: endonuclease/exonuclease/phosphatase family protein [Planctomycetia bacterium]|nr:endonuclease/exonuclease/phosphatase family protein [Planctomycetia bacterium]
MNCPRALVLFLVLLFSAEVAVLHADDEQDSLKVMTYNVRYASDTPPNAWGERLPVALAMLAEQQPDVIGTQETQYRQAKDFASHLEGYDWIGLGREGGSRGEFMAMYYRTERLEPLEFDHFWLSDTPDRIGSTTWGNSNRRMVTWVRFRDRATKREFYCFNTHFDHEIQLAREKSAALLWERIQALNTKLPVIVLGDFNAVAQHNVAYDLLVGDDKLTDAWLAAADRGPLFATFHGYHRPQPDGSRIDWILTRGPVRCERADIITFERDGQYPSDHFPVTAQLRFDPAN